MGQDYIQSLAQKNITFATDVVVTTTPGDNYYKVMIFIPTADKATYLTGTPTSSTSMWVTSTTYAALTQGKLKTWLAGFFAGNALTPVFLCVFSTLATTYNQYKTYAYFKLTIDSSGNTSDQALSVLIKAEGKDKKLSQLWIGISDDTAAIATTMLAAAEDAVIVYHWDSTINGALCQLGATLSVANSTLTPVGSSLDYLQTNNVQASGGVPYAIGTVDLTNGHDWSAGGSKTFKVTLKGINSTVQKTVTLSTNCTTLALTVSAINTALVAGSIPAVDMVCVANGVNVELKRIGDGSACSFILEEGSGALAQLGLTTPSAGQNLDPTTAGVLEALKVGYFTLLGNGTLYVALEGGQSILGNVAAAYWIRDYIDFVCEIKGIELVTQRNKFLNNDTYQAILGILTKQAGLFTLLGRLTDFIVTAPTFAALGATGDTITIPNAWSATYVDNVRTVTVYGTLTITLS